MRSDSPYHPLVASRLTADGSRASRTDSRSVGELATRACGLWRVVHRRTCTHTQHGVSRKTTRENKRNRQSCKLQRHVQCPVPVGSLQLGARDAWHPTSLPRGLLYLGAPLGPSSKFCTRYAPGVPALRSPASLRDIWYIFDMQTRPWHRCHRDRVRPTPQPSNSQIGARTREMRGKLGKRGGGRSATCTFAFEAAGLRSRRPSCIDHDRGGLNARTTTWRRP